MNHLKIYRSINSFSACPALQDERRREGSEEDVGQGPEVCAGHGGPRRGACRPGHGPQETPLLLQLK